MTPRLPADPAGKARAPGDPKLFAPSAARNVGPITEILADLAPHQGRALELASGTGQHVVAFARRLPGLIWQPTEPDETRRASIDAYAAEAGLPNLRPARPLDATRPGWAADWPGQDLIVLVNLLHLIPDADAGTLIAEAARALGPGGRFVIYGPFLRAGAWASDNDRVFDTNLRAADPAVGYKDDFDTLDRLVAAGLDIVAVVEMPANNLCLIAGRPPA